MSDLGIECKEDLIKIFQLIKNEMLKINDDIYWGDQPENELIKDFVKDYFSQYENDEKLEFYAFVGDKPKKDRRFFLSNPEDKDLVDIDLQSFTNTMQSLIDLSKKGID